MLGYIKKSVEKSKFIQNWKKITGILHAGCLQKLL